MAAITALNPHAPPFDYLVQQHPSIDLFLPRPHVFFSFYYLYQPAHFCYTNALLDTTPNSTGEEATGFKSRQRSVTVVGPRRRGLKNEQELKNSVSRCCWVPKSEAEPPKVLDTAVDALKSKLAGRATVMIRNIPNRLTRSCLLKLLDEICFKQNQSLKPCCAFDFLYLPIDFKGYAFVNFTSSEGAVNVCASMNGRGWESSPESKKICDVSPARIQGKKELMKHFKKVSYPCYTADYLPVVLHPPRNGSNAASSAVSTLGYALGGLKPS